MNQIGILLTSRNNYKFMEKFWIPKMKKCCLGDTIILNIDEDSTGEEKEKGRIICSDNNIFFMDREEKGMHHNVLTAIKFFPDNVEYIIWFQHDCWPLQKDFFFKFNKLVCSGNLSRFGAIGFNAIAQNMFKDPKFYNSIMKDFKKGKKPLGVLSRSHLEKHDLYYCGYKVKNRINVPVPRRLFMKPSAISEVCWYAVAVNVENFVKYIDVNRKFHFHKSWDDISLQFLYHNIYNIVIPSLYIEHRPDLKPETGLPRSSVRLSKKGDDTFHSLVGFDPKDWIDQWGWDFENPKTFEKVKDKYKDTLLYDFYNWDYTKGPLKVFDLG